MEHEERKTLENLLNFPNFRSNFVQTQKKNDDVVLINLQCFPLLHVNKTTKFTRNPPKTVNKTNAVGLFTNSCNLCAFGKQLLLCIFDFHFLSGINAVLEMELYIVGNGCILLLFDKKKNWARIQKAIEYV